jgi:hypothetical protein
VGELMGGGEGRRATGGSPLRGGEGRDMQYCDKACWFVPFPPSVLESTPGI